MKWFNRKKPEPEPEQPREIVASSEMPYKVGETEDEEGRLRYVTFTEFWKLHTGKTILMPQKLSFVNGDHWHLDLYLPDESTSDLLSTLGEDAMVFLWIFLDNEVFFIIAPEYCDPEISSHRDTTHFHLNLSATGFHSELKSLTDKYSTEEICNLICRLLSEHDIVEILPRVIRISTKEDFDCRTIELLSPTAEMIREAMDAIRRKAGV